MMIALMLATGCSVVKAGDGDRGERYADNREAREQRQAARQERQRDVRAVQEMQPQNDPRVQSPYPQYQSQPQYQPQQDGGRRGNRMSPEERRALRRQIDQASHEIYLPNR